MASTYIPYTESEEILKTLEKSFKSFYQNSDRYMMLVHDRTKAKEHKFYEQISRDSKEFINKKGFSNSWLWSLLFEENKEKRKFYKPHIETFESLIVFYQDHIFIQQEKEGKTVYKKIGNQHPRSSSEINNDSKNYQDTPLSQGNTYGTFKYKHLLKRKNLLIIGISILVIFFGLQHIRSLKNELSKVEIYKFDENTVQEGHFTSLKRDGFEASKKIGMLRDGYPEYFKVYIYYSNSGTRTIYNGRASIDFQERGKKGDTVLIKTSLFARSCATIYDAVKIVSPHEDWSLELIDVKRFVGYKECPGKIVEYVYSNKMYKPKQTYKIDDLNLRTFSINNQTFNCSDGYIEATFKASFSKK